MTSEASETGEYPRSERYHAAALRIQAMPPMTLGEAAAVWHAETTRPEDDPTPGVGHAAPTQ